MGRRQIRTGEFASGITMIGGIVFTIFAISTVGNSTGPVGLAILMGIGVAVWGAYGVFSGRGTPTGEFVETDDGEEREGFHRAPSFEESLRQLERLRDDGLITEGEYARKREQILSKPW